MKSLRELIAEKEKTILLKGFDPVAAQGFTQVPNLILKNGDLTEGAKLVYALLLSYAWNNDSCFPGQDRLAEDCGKTQSWVSKRMIELEFPLTSPRMRKRSRAKIDLLAEVVNRFRESIHAEAALIDQRKGK